MFELIYFDLVRDELLASHMDEETAFLIIMRDTLILEFPRPTMLIALSHGGKGSGGGARSKAKIRVNIHGDPLDFRLVMEQDYTNWNPVVKAEIRLQVVNGIFEITFLPPEKTAIGYRWVFKKKEEAVPLDSHSQDQEDQDQDLDQDHAEESRSRAKQWRLECEKMRIQICYKARLVAKDYEQQYEVDF